MKYEKELQAAKDIAVKAGKLAVKMRGEAAYWRKSDTSVVTDADLASQRLIKTYLLKRFPKHHFLAEETLDEEKPKDFRNIGKDELLWVVDPIDGTDSYRTGLPGWSVAIALLKGDKPVIGVIYAPVMDELYWTVEGEGTFLGENEIRVKPGRVVNSAKFITVDSSYHRCCNCTFPGKIRSMGSTALHMCYVARGSSIGTVFFGHVWDFAAGMLLIANAGGVVKQIDGKKILLKPLLDGGDLQVPGLATAKGVWEKVRKGVT